MYYRCELDRCQPEEKKLLKNFCKVQKVIFFEKIQTGENHYWMYYISSGSKEQNQMNINRRRVLSIPTGAKRCSEARFKSAVM